MRSSLLAPLLLITASAFAQTAEQSTAAAIARVTRLNPQLNAVIALDPTALDQARALDRRRSAHGPLFGMPILLKDNIEAKGPLPTTAGSLALMANATGRDAPLVAGLRVAGAVILGKANLSEWANIRSSHSMSGWSAVGGQTRNPYALDRSPCGSSAGSAAAVAAGLVDAAIGTETDGSITCPASMNGVVGLKPTVGLVSRARIVPISHTQDTAGPLAKDVATAALVLSAIAGSDPGDPATSSANAHRSDYRAALERDALSGARIGVLRVTDLPSRRAAVFNAALDVLKAQGATLVNVAEPPGLERLGAAEMTVLLTELKVDLNAYLATTPSAVESRTLADLIAFDRSHAAREMGLFDQDLFEQAEATGGLDDPAYGAALALARKLAGKDGIDALLAANDVEALVFPTAAPAWLIDAVNGDRGGGGGSAVGSLAAIAGYPHLTVPMGTVRGLPVGLSFVGPAWSEARLLSLGYSFEQAAGARAAPRFLPSIEESPGVAKLLRPASP
jgi:amidase